jgi:hypothetical protein
MPTKPWPSRPFTSTPWQIVHIVRYEDTSTTDEHGNFPVIDKAPVVRKIYDHSQFGRRGSSHEVMGPEFQERIETILHLSVPDPGLYSAGDQIIMFPDLDASGNYVAGSGVAYWVDGDPAEDRMSPWPRYTMQFGGVVKVRRIT